MKRIVAIVGTRPEAIKMASVIQTLHRHPDKLETKLCAIIQRRQTLDPAPGLPDEI